ncbi:MAG: GDP-mannose 4,6-dehydratase [Alphaproteobacteria bacterium]|nr:GDP-mannose 4,6-dehydratase [Alphaproteobacteria bacterium]
MRVAVTGADGFTGAYLIDALRGAGLESRALAADLTDPAAVAAEVAEAPFDRLIHLAGEAFVAGDDWRRFYAVNQLGTLNLLDAVAAARPGARCILASSAQVYGPAASGLVDESRPPAPDNHYALSKLAMELCARVFADRLEIVVVRPFNYTGRGQQPRYLVPKIVDHFRRHAAAIELGNLDVRRDLGDVRAVADAYVGLALVPAPPRLANIATGTARSVRDVVALASSLTGHTLEIRVNPAFVRAADVPILAGDPTVLRNALPNWRPRPFEETLEWMLAEPAAPSSR